MSLMYRISHEYNNDMHILLKYQDKIKDLIFFI